MSLVGIRPAMDPLPGRHRPVFRELLSYSFPAAGKVPLPVLLATQNICPSQVWGKRGDTPGPPRLEPKVLIPASGTSMAPSSICSPPSVSPNPKVTINIHHRTAERLSRVAREILDFDQGVTEQDGPYLSTRY